MMIMKNPPPKMKSKGWSNELMDFCSKCLTKNVKERFSSTQLLKHPFMFKAKNYNAKEFAADINYFVPKGNKQKGSG